MAVQAQTFMPTGLILYARLSPSRGGAVDCLLDDACIDSGTAVSVFICLFLPSATNAKQELHSFQNRTPGASIASSLQGTLSFLQGETPQCLPPTSPTKRLLPDREIPELSLHLSQPRLHIDGRGRSQRGC